MPVVHMRIDNRLIHGQVTVTWASSLNADHMVVCNDKVAVDPIQKVMLPAAARRENLGPLRRRYPDRLRSSGPSGANLHYCQVPDGCARAAGRRTQTAGAQRGQSGADSRHHIHDGDQELRRYCSGRGRIPPDRRAGPQADRTHDAERERQRLPGDSRQKGAVKLCKSDATPASLHHPSLHRWGATGPGRVPPKACMMTSTSAPWYLPTARSASA